ncbi:MAG: sigma-54 dependent transcriptional regulator [Verrucomicrobiota bacterium]
MNRTVKILLIEDDADLADSLVENLESHGYEVAHESDGEAGLAAALEGSPDVVLTDFRLPFKGGVEILEAIRQEKSNLPVILITAHGTTELAIEATQKGAFDYLIKPFRTADLLEVLASAVSTSRMSGERVELDPDENTSALQSLIGQCREMQEVYKNVGMVANKAVTVLIRGETGTGKELVARAIYQHSDRADLPFVAVNCTAIPESLLESELFGHERGAFTGAVARRIGRFEQASGGTLFLDEIGDMSPETQVKMLRVLQERTIRRVGGEDEVPVDVRVIAATHRDLERMVAEKRFREDLFYRINTAMIHLPPLRERNGDIRLLIDHIVANCCREFQVTAPEISRDAIDALEQHRWPGNIRELENVIAKLVIKSKGFAVSPADVEAALETIPDQSGDSLAPYESIRREKVVECLKRAETGDLDLPYLHLIDDLEREIIHQAILITHGNQSAAARLLGISRITYREKLDKYGLLKRKKDPVS